MQPPEPVLVVDLFPREREALLDVLRSLTAEDWQRPTICPGWSVHDIAAHLVGDDVGRLSRGYGYAPVLRRDGEDLVVFIDRQNAEWVTAWRRASPPFIIDMLETTGARTQQYFESLDPAATGGSVWWATGDDPAPVWLDVARELTERWHHQAQIRDAVGAPPLDDPAILGPVIATFTFALPRTFRDVDAAAGTAVGLTVTGSAGGRWLVVRDDAAWRLMVGSADSAAARVSVDQDTYWRLATKGISADVAEIRATLEGRRDLARQLLTTVAVIA